jgi:hypothetical protein
VRKKEKTGRKALAGKVMQVTNLACVVPGLPVIVDTAD